ncbi:GM10764, partial [Drosophila sechellia]
SSVLEKARPVNDQLAELGQQVQALENRVKKYARQLADMTDQVAQMAALLRSHRMRTF